MVEGRSMTGKESVPVGNSLANGSAANSFTRGEAGSSVGTVVCPETVRISPGNGSGSAVASAAF